MHKSRKQTNCLSSLWVALNKVAIARNALTLPRQRNCAFQNKIKVHLASQCKGSQLWALGKHAAKQEASAEKYLSLILDSSF